MNSITTAPSIHNKKKLFLFTDGFVAGGGVEKVAVQAINELSKDYHITLFYLFNIAPEVVSQLGANVTLHRICLKGRVEHFLLNIPFLGGIIFNKNISSAGTADCGIILKPACLCAAYSGLAEKYIFWNHGCEEVRYLSGNLSIFQWLNKCRKRMLFDRCEAIWCLNRTIADAMQKAFGQSNVEVVPNSIDCEHIQKLSNEPVNDTEITHEQFNVSIVGRLSPEKGQIRVINAMKSIDTPIHLMVIGAGVERENLMREATKLGSQHNISFLGYKENPYAYIAKSDLLVCSSYSESFGIVILEAMALGTPVIATKTIGAVDVTDNGQFGWLVSNDDHSIAEAISKIAQGEMIPYSLDAAKKRAEQYDITQFRDRLRITVNEIVKE